MARAATGEPEGLVYRPELVTAAEEAELLGLHEELRFDPIVLDGQAARRTARHGTARHYGLGTATRRRSGP